MQLKGDDLIKSYVLDTGTIFLYFIDHQAVSLIINEIESKSSKGYIPQLVFCEIFYKTQQKFGKSTAYLRSKIIRESSINEYILNEKDTYRVGEAKSKYPFLSIIDAVIFATAIATKSTLVTTDSDFLKIKGLKVKKIKF